MPDNCPGCGKTLRLDYEPAEGRSWNPVLYDEDGVAHAPFRCEFELLQEQLDEAKNAIAHQESAALLEIADWIASPEWASYDREAVSMTHLRQLMGRAIRGRAMTKKAANRAISPLTPARRALE